MTQITPTLAVDLDLEKARFPLMAFHKIDGVRASHFKGHLHGRSMDPFKNSAVVAKFSGAEYAGFDGEMTIDGRLNNNGLDGETICSLTTGLMNRAKVKKGEDSLPTNVVWNLFDWVDQSTVGMTYLERYIALESRVAAERPAGVRVLRYVLIESAEEALAFISRCVDEGYEGAIFRDPQALHKSGRATAKGNDFWRFKPVSDKDALVTGYEEAMENQNEAKTNSLGRTERSTHKENLVGKGMVGTILATDVATGLPIRLGPGSMSHEERKRCWEAYLANHSASGVGDYCKYTSLDTGVLDQPRQARFATWRAKEDVSHA